MTRTSIFQLEKRFNLDHEMNKLMNDYIKYYNVDYRLHGNYGSDSLLKLINKTILHCPFVYGSRTFDEYLSEYEIDTMRENIQALYKLEFIANYIIWLNFYLPEMGKNGHNKDNLTIIATQISYIAKMMNYKLTKIQQDGLPFTPGY
ncbi:hypothetical protein MGH68_13715 [Erysipelothrix sp. D19-032]